MRIYFSGIGGTGIGPLAEMALDAGYSVTGSDAEETPMTKRLTNRGVKLNIGQDGKFLEQSHRDQPIDWLVYTAALRDDHPELLTAQQLGIKTSKRDGFINHLATDYNLKLICISGTHGKTTTTAMLVWAFKQLNLPLSYFVGTTIGFGPSGYFNKNSQYFIYEGDEYNRNFLQFKPYLSAITSIDYDHPDTYPTEQEYSDAFRQFASNSRIVFSWQDQKADIFQGLDNIKFIKPEAVNQNIRLAGACNRRNASLAQAVLKELDINTETDQILSDFPGTDRRFEKLADNLYSDYAHHPTEIAACLQLASEISDNIAVVYQPHQNIRQYQIKDQYINQFELAEDIYWLPTYDPKARESDNLKMLTPQELTANLTNRQNVHFADLNDQLWQDISQARKNGQIVVCMGAGSIDNWLHQKLK